MNFKVKIHCKKSLSKRPFYLTNTFFCNAHSCSCWKRARPRNICHNGTVFVITERYFSWENNPHRSETTKIATKINNESAVIFDKIFNFLICWHHHSDQDCQVQNLVSEVLKLGSVSTRQCQVSGRDSITRQLAVPHPLTGVVERN